MVGGGERDGPAGMGERRAGVGIPAGEAAEIPAGEAVEIPAGEAAEIPVGEAVEIPAGEAVGGAGSAAFAFAAERASAKTFCRRAWKGVS